VTAILESNGDRATEGLAVVLVPHAYKIDRNARAGRQNATKRPDECTLPIPLPYLPGPSAATARSAIWGASELAQSGPVGSWRLAVRSDERLPSAQLPTVD